MILEADRIPIRANVVYQQWPSMDEIISHKSVTS
jgi:hypothetical protein